MKTIFINCSPKKKFSASAYFISVQKFFVKGEAVKEILRNRADHERILAALEDGDNIVFALPLYIDCLPSHVLVFLKDMEEFCNKKQIKLNVYAIANNGYIEGNEDDSYIYIVNTCTVTNTSDNKSLKTIRQIKRNHPNYQP